MKYVLLQLLLLDFAVSVQAQKENNVWVGGNDVVLDFNSGVPAASPRADINFWRTNASICDKDGNFLFASNGYRVLNKDFLLMTNGSNLEIGDYEQWGYNELAIHDGAVIVPVPGDSNRYYLFHLDCNITTFDTITSLMPTHLYRCTIDMTLSGGLGKVVPAERDIVVIADTLPRVGMKAVKHANGRDYWLLYHEAGTNAFKRFLVDPYGVHGPYVQHIGFRVELLDDLFSNSPFEFTKDASKAAHLSAATSRIFLYDFDRCTGTFYNQDSLQLDDSLYYFQDVEFSPSGRYLYLSAQHGLQLWQFDLHAADVLNSGQLVAVYDGATNPFPTDFDAMALGADGQQALHQHLRRQRIATRRQLPGQHRHGMRRRAKWGATRSDGL
jgi:hypothetical protein